MRYTLPGLGYFLLSYILIFYFRPQGLEVTNESTWLFGAIALVGSVPVGYLIHQGYLLWNFLCGRIEHFPHIQKLGELISKNTIERISLNIDGEPFQVNVNELREEMIRLGEEYIKKTHVIFHKDTIKKYGYLTPLHDLIFRGTKIHDVYLRGAWTYSRITRALLGALFLALLPWGFALLVEQGDPISLTIPMWIIAIEFICLAITSFFVSKWSRNECDLNEQFLTWLYEKKVLASKEKEEMKKEGKCAKPPRLS